MLRKKRKNYHPDQEEMLDITGKLTTAPCVPALREAVKAWRAGGYKGTTDTTRILLNYWFSTDHKLLNGNPFRYHVSQKEAIETMIFVWEYEKVRTRKGLLERYATTLKDVRLAPYDEFARYCIKMATGSGKTKVMSLIVVWQYLNAMREQQEEAQQYAKTFLVIAPNVIVLERLKTDFAGGRIFKVDPLIPKALNVFWNDFDCVVRGDGERPHYEGTLFLTNIQQFYERRQRLETGEPEAMTGVMGSRPPLKKLELTDFGERIAFRSGNLIVINDEGHHTHDEESEWNNVIRQIHTKTPVTLQADFSATPRFQKGALFPWIIYDYPLKQAILENIVKRPVKGIAHVQEARSNIASVRYKAFLTAGVERWREYKKELDLLNKKPVLFIMLNDTGEADEIGDWIRTKYPAEFGGNKTLVIHTDSSGDVSKKDLEKAREIARSVDEDKNKVNAIVSVLMLREGWDVQNVTVVVGLRPYTSKANILPEQTIGRGLRLMFRSQPGGYKERVDIIGNRAFIEFVEDLERLEDIKLDSFEVGKDKLKIVTIVPVPEKKAFDIGLPLLSPILVRKKSLSQEIAEMDVSNFMTPILPIDDSDKAAETFIYEGYDIITLKKEFQREYTLPEVQTPQEVIGYYARRIAEEVKLPAQFAALVPKVREYFENKAFGKTVDLNDPAIIKAMSDNVAHYVCVQAFKKELMAKTICEREPKLEGADRFLSGLTAFPWSQMVYEGSKSIFNLNPCENELECKFAHFLNKAPDVKAFAKLPQTFGFCIEYTDEAYNLRYYYPDFVAIDTGGMHWLLETKGMESEETKFKDYAATIWCENATKLTGAKWEYKKVPQQKFEELQPEKLSDLKVL